MVIKLQMVVCNMLHRDKNLLQWNLDISKDQETGKTVTYSNYNKVLLNQGSFTYILLNYCAKENHLLYRGLPCMHVNYIGVLLYQQRFLTLESHGKSFFQGVRFSVQTSSLGSAACLRRLEFVPKSEEIPSLLKESFGLVVVLLSMKLSDAQN